MSNEDTFKKYELNKEQIELFLKLRGDVSEKIDDEILALIICQKKIYEKCLTSVKNIVFIIDNYDFGKVKFQPKFVKLMINKAIIFNPDVESIDGFKLIVVKPLNVVREPGFTKEYVIQFFMHNFYFALTNFPKISSKGVYVIVDLSNTGISTIKYLDFSLLTTFHKVLKKIPVRPQKILVYKPPTFFRVVYSVIRPFMSKKIADRFQILKREKDFLKYFKKETFLNDYGGDLKYNHVEVIKKTFPVYKDIVDELVSNKTV